MLEIKLIITYVRNLSELGFYIE